METYNFNNLIYTQYNNKWNFFIVKFVGSKVKHPNH